MPYTPTPAVSNITRAPFDEMGMLIVITRTILLHGECVAELLQRYHASAFERLEFVDVRIVDDASIANFGVSLPRLKFLLVVVGWRTPDPIPSCWRAQREVEMRHRAESSKMINCSSRTLSLSPRASQNCG